MTDHPEPGWCDPFRPTVPGDDDYATLIADLRSAQEVVTRSKPSAEAAQTASRLLREMWAVLTAYEVAEDDQIAGRRWDLAGRAQALIPALHIDRVGERTATARFTVGRFYSGRYAMNGGVAPLVFDEILARLANSGDRPFARTARLAVNYRAPAPLNVELRLEAEIVAQEGRKRFLRGVMFHGTAVVADAEGLWVQTLPHRETAAEPDCISGQRSTA